MTSLAPKDVTKAKPRWSVLRRLDTWATRSLAVGAVATVIDLTLGTALLNHGMSPRFSAMLGTALGATFGFLANRYFAFREHNPRLTSPAVRFVMVTAMASVVHGQVVAWLNAWPAFVRLAAWALPGWVETIVGTEGLPFIPAKMMADIVVFNIGQLILMRYFVFPRLPARTATADTVLESEGA